MYVCLWLLVHRIFQVRSEANESLRRLNTLGGKAKGADRGPNPHNVHSIYYNKWVHLQIHRVLHNYCSFGSSCTYVKTNYLPPQMMAVSLKVCSTLIVCEISIFEFLNPYRQGSGSESGSSWEVGSGSGQYQTGSKTLRTGRLLILALSTV